MSFPLNKKNNHLVILVATFNRISSLKKMLNSIRTETSTPHEIIVIDGGSSDGTVPYLKSQKKLTPIFQGKLIGASRCYNRVWRKINCKYTIALSDDEEVINQSLDKAVEIMEKNPDIGMVGLKMKETKGPWKNKAYMGALSEYGILNCNHGLVRYSLLKSVGFFNEGYYNYSVDPDLTASILSTGNLTVMTKKIGLLHHRAMGNNVTEKRAQTIIKKSMNGRNNSKIYFDKFNYLEKQSKSFARLDFYLKYFFSYPLLIGTKIISGSLGRLFQDSINTIRGDFISPLDMLINIHKPYHLVQKIPQKLLSRSGNPYNYLISN